MFVTVPALDCDSGEVTVAEAAHVSIHSQGAEEELRHVPLAPLFPSGQAPAQETALPIRCCLPRQFTQLRKPPYRHAYRLSNPGRYTSSTVDSRLCQVGN